MSGLTGRPRSSVCLSDGEDGANANEKDHDLGNSRDHDDQQPPKKRQRLRLSCLMCRRRKQSCDREHPCGRCVQFDIADRCEYEFRPTVAARHAGSLLPPIPAALSSAGLDAAAAQSGPGAPPAIGDFGLGINNDGPAAESLLRRTDPREVERIRRLELEVATLKGLLVRQAASLDGSTLRGHSPGDAMTTQPNKPTEAQGHGAHYLKHNELGSMDLPRFFSKDFKARQLGMYTAWMAFTDVPGLVPFMKETGAVRILALCGKVPKKTRPGSNEQGELASNKPSPELEMLLPSKEEADKMVFLYLDDWEQLHRVVHIPTFKRSYQRFWDAPEDRQAPITALVLCIMSIVCCAQDPVWHENEYENMRSRAHIIASGWVEAVDKWYAARSQKHRGLVDFQIACLLYLSKRVNGIKKKRFWKNTGSLVQDAVLIGLHRDPSRMGGKSSLYQQEMRRRLWATIREFDLESALYHGLPTMVPNLNSDVMPPRNVDDAEFDEDSEDIPPSRPASQYTYASYQHLSQQSLPLRQELTRLLTSQLADLDYEQVIRYSSEISDEIDSLPKWDACGVRDAIENDKQGPKRPIIAHGLLALQLLMLMVPLHHPYLRKAHLSSKYRYSEVSYYNAIRDMITLLDRLAMLKIRVLHFMRDEPMSLSLNLCAIQLLRPPGPSSSLINSSSSSGAEVFELLDKCLRLHEDRLLRSGHENLWGLALCAVYGLLEIHLGVKTSEAAKAAAAGRFLSLYSKMGLQVENAKHVDQSVLQQTSTQTPPLVVNARAEGVQGAYWWHVNDDAASALAPPVPIAPAPDFSGWGLAGLNFDEFWGTEEGTWDFIYA